MNADVVCVYGGVGAALCVGMWTVVGCAWCGALWRLDYERAAGLAAHLVASY